MISSIIIVTSKESTDLSDWHSNDVKVSQQSIETEVKLQISFRRVQVEPSGQMEVQTRVSVQRRC